MTQVAPSRRLRSVWISAAFLLLSGCEPCALVMGGHCQDREQNKDEDLDQEGRDSDHCFARPNMPPLAPLRSPRG